MGITEVRNSQVHNFLFSINSKKETARRLKLENTLEFLENDLTDNLKKQQYELLKCELDELYNKIAEGVRV